MANFDSESPIFISGAAAPKAWDVIDMRTNEYKPPLLNGEQDLCKRRERTKQPMKLGTPLRKNMHAPQISRESHPKSEHPSVTQPTSQPFIHSEQANLCVLCQKRWVESSASILSLLSIVPTQPITVSLFEPRLWRERKGGNREEGQSVCCSLHPLYCR